MFAKRSILRGFSISLVIVITVTVFLGISQSTSVQAANDLNFLPEQMIKSDGTLNLSTSYSGNLDISNYGVVLDPARGPVLSPLETGNNWSVVGPGLNSQVYAIAISPTGDVYAGGNFTSAGNLSTFHIAKWNGTSWSRLGDGLLGTVEAIAISDTGDVYAGGYFSNAGGDPNADYIAKWNGTTWSALGTTPLNKEVFSLATKGTDVYAGGWFTDAGGDVNSDYIAKWNGTTWSALGTTPLVGPTNVFSIEVSATGDVYAGGAFSNAGGDPNADKIAKFSNGTWSALGTTPLNYSVQSVAIGPAGEIYAGGSFTNAGGDPNADYIAKFSNGAWSALGTTPFTFSSARDIFVSGTDVYAGFMTGGGAGPDMFIAKWDGSTWSDPGTTQLDYNVFAVAVNGTDLYAGGEFHDAGGDPVADFFAKLELSTPSDTTAPTVGTFTVASPSSSLNIPIAAFTASDNVGVTAYKITESSTAPGAGDTGWSGSVPGVYTVGGDGSYTLYPWAKDAAGNVSAIFGTPRTVTVDTLTTKTITAFNFASLAVTGTINEATHTIAATVPFGTDVTALAATFATTGASVKVGITTQVSGTTTNNFANPVIYTVTAADASTQAYTVTVTVAPNPAKAITAFGFTNPAAIGTINGTDIAVTVPFGTNITALAATFATTGTSAKIGTIVQVSGTTTNNFTNPVIYTVTAADASTQAYIVTVTVAPNSAKAITAFGFANPLAIGTINGTDIAVTVPFGTDITALAATFTTTGTSVKIGAIVQVSGITTNNFTNLVTYTVTAADASTQTFTVTITIAINSAKAITAFGFTNPAVTGTISGTNIAVTVPFGTDVTTLVAIFTTTGVSVKVGAAAQVSGITANNFKNPTIYTVTAVDASIKAYTVTVTVSQIPVIPGAAALISPKNDIGTNYNPNYIWTKAAATYYRLYVNGPGGVIIDQWFESSSICDATLCSATPGPSAMLTGGNYSWYVQTYNSAGYGPWSNSGNGTTFSTTLTMPTAPAVAVLTYPLDLADIGINYNPVYTWNKVPTATYYRLYVTGPSGAVLDQWYPTTGICTAITCSVTSPTLTGGNYSWYVQTYNSIGYGLWSNGSTATTFKTTFPIAPVAAVLTTPKNDIATNYSPTYTWNKVTMATYYHLYVAGPGGVVLDQWYQASNICDTTTCSVASPTLGGGAYTWYVQTYNTAGYGAWSNNSQPTSFNTSTAPPAVAVLTAPKNAIGTDYTPTYIWNKAAGATYYHLYVAGPSGVVLDQWYSASICDATACYVASPILGGGAHIWYVQTYGPTGYGSWSNNSQPTNFSTTTLFAPGAAALTAPKNNIGTDYNPTYTWDKVVSATYYHLYVAGPGGVVLDQWYPASGICNTTTCYVTSPILGGGAHVWYVQTYNAAGYGAWSNNSQPTSFSTSTPTVPAGAVLTSPTPGGTMAYQPLIIYRWDKVNMATWYHLYVKRPTGVIKDLWIQASIDCDSTTCSIATPTLESGYYTWWIQTYNSAGYGPWKSATFTVSP